MIHAVQPDMTVNARTFIVPSFILRGIYPHDQHIFFSETDIIADIIGNTTITAGIGAQVISIDPDLALAVNAVELNYKTLSRIGFCDLKMFSVPANTVLRVQWPDRFVTV